MRNILRAGTCLSAAFIATPLLAQQASTAPAQAAAVPGHEEVKDIIVTAERRSTTIQKVGFSITAVGGETMRVQEIHTPAALVQMVPGITLNSADKSITVVQIRGSVSTFRAATLDAPIGFFQDDIYYPYSSDLNLNFYDLNHAEVLRGPQGTLFGRNVTGGAIVLQTNNPTFTEDYLLQGTAGNYNYFRTEGMLNSTIVDDKIAGRLAFSLDRTDGNIDRPNYGERGNRGSTASVRGKLLIKPSDSLHIVLSGDYTKASYNGVATQLIPATTTGAIPALPAPLTANGPFSFDRWTDSETTPGPNTVKQRGVDAHVTLDIPLGTITSITAYRRTNVHSYVNNDQIAGPPPLLYDSRVNNKWFTQEIRLASNPNRLSYVVGAFYLHGNYNTLNTLSYNPTPGSALFALVNPYPTTIARNQTGIVNSIAAFGEATFKFTDKLSLSAGARYTRDTKQLRYSATSPTNDPLNLAGPGFSYPAGGLVGVRDKRTWDAFTPRVTLKYAPTQSINTYVTYSKGFKSGGWSDGNYTLAGATLALNPEHSTNIEAGVKSRLFGNHLDLNIDIFRQKTKNLQNFSFVGGVAHTYNGTSLTKGVEAEATIRPVRNLSFTLNYAYLDAKYLQLVDPATPLLNYSGNPLKYTPKNSLYASAQYTFDLSNGGSLTPQMNYQYSAKYSTADANNTKLYPAVYNATEQDNVDARLTYASPTGKFSVSAWVKNLTNHFKIDYADVVSPFLTTTPGVAYWRAATNTPRAFGGTVTIKR